MGRPDGRIEALDALRGFAIFGILLINIQVFSGWGFLGDEGRDGLSWSEHDAWIKTVLDVLVRAKFYSLFSLLFGYSFSMMAAKVGEQATAMHLKRMAGLLLFGLAHTLLLWPWDILLLYAVMGLLLTPFLRRGALVLLAWGILVLGAGAFIQWRYEVLGGYDGFVLRTFNQSVPAMSRGSYAEVVAANWHLTISVAVEWVQGVRPLRVLGLFLIGAAAASMGLARSDSGRRALLFGAAAAGLLAGLLLSIAEHADDVAGGLLEPLKPLGEVLGAPLLAIGYAAALLLFWHGRHLLARFTCSLFAPVGRMALTNYIGQSAVCVVLFYGFGLGLFAEWSLARQMLFAFALFSAQVIASHLWLSLFAQGPLEWLWRKMIGRRKLPRK